MPDLPGVELARPGTWRLSTGTTTFTEAMLRDAADFYVATGGQPIPVGLGHQDDRFDGDPAFGRIANIRYAVDDRGPVLLGDLVGMTDWLAAAAPKHWPSRSVEGWQGFEYQGRTYALALTRLALLGAAPPAIPNLQALQEAVAAAAAGGATRIAATAAADTDPPGPPSAGPDAPPDAQEGAGMDPAKIREALGLPADASDDDVRAALVAAGITPLPAAVDPPPAPPVADAPKPVDLPTDVPQPLAAAAAAAGAVVLDKGVWDQAQAQIAEGVAAAKKLREQERDALLGQAVQDGRIPPANRDYWAQLWDRDPKGTADVVGSLRRNLVPVMATGYMGADDDDGPDPYDHLFPPTAKG